MGEFSSFASDSQPPITVVPDSLHVGKRGAEPTLLSVWIMDPRRVETERSHALLSEVRKAARHSNRSLLSVIHAADTAEGTAPALPPEPVSLTALTRRSRTDQMVIPLLYERQWQAALALLNAISLLRENGDQASIVSFLPIVVESERGIPPQAATDLARALHPFPFVLALPETAIQVEHGGIVHIAINVAAALEEAFLSLGDAHRPLAQV